MFDAFQQKLQQYDFTRQEIEQLTQSAKLIELPTRHMLLHQGEVAKEIFFLLEGICHAAYLTDKGKEFSKQFYWENDWIIGFESLVNQQPSPYQLESLTQCSILSLPIETLITWREQKHSIYLKLLETQLMYKENKERFMLLYTPEERYELFCQHYPNLRKRLNDYQIAAYLGITSISLSRIKKRNQS
ncbi:Crp/Fnr family transcriptional regulator [Photobacterium ganghwense]|uniref:Crp/Fnr family transcriptional regulator n=1 Tax=Photobacterium ganghwense TaxID=320778 RepID=A0A0J1H9J3_9GAMM|nr:Crp/Fnr family transcriptional regulator [Photobacterium ganghwense]KLV08359.1 Crp/Fnr family transcriptional regulator [Photobacterium ganghwense]PSU07494.1 Crp/Fnr family transcriptional regulator [Photobacterium ganghwense]